MLRVFNFDVYALLDQRAYLSFVTPFIANKFHICHKVVHEPFEVSNPVKESIIARRAYRNCPISNLHKVVSWELVELCMVYFDVILRLDLLHASYASICCRTHRVKS